MDLRVGHCRGNLTEASDVVEDPEGTPVRADDYIVLMNH
jgi:hypothetical protein